MMTTNPVLTCRQKETLCLITFPNRQIAHILGVSQSTVANRLTGIYKALGLGHISSAPGARRTAVVTAALGYGLVTLDEIALGDRPVTEREREEPK